MVVAPAEHEASKLKQKHFVPRERGWAIERHAPSGNSLAYRMLFGGDVTTEISFMLPGFRWEVVENAKSRLFTLTCLTPENENSHAHHSSHLLAQRAAARCDEADPALPGSSANFSIRTAAWSICRTPA